MLRSLHIRDFVIVDQADINFDPGFTVFSGETGAGKSILVDALGLALGGRGDATMLREGAKRSDISAVFSPTPSVQTWLAAHDLDADDELVLRRVIDAQGRSRAFINGIPSTLVQLRELAESLVDIHGQHAHQSLLKPASQRAVLDAHGGHADLVRQVGKAWQRWQDAERRLQSARENAAALAEERERLQWRLSELEKLGLQPGEWETLNQDHNRLAHAQSIMEGAGLALTVLDDEEASAQHALNAAAHRIEPLLRHDGQLQSIYDAIESARIAVGEAVSDLNHYLSKLELDPAQLEATEARVSAIFDMARKLKTEPELLPELQESLEAQLRESENAADLEALAQSAQEAANDYDALATQLSEARHAASAKLAPLVTDAMQELAMQGGRFEIELTPGTPGPHGKESVEFLMAGHPGTTPRPLSKVASGGELARVSLALCVIASQAARVPTLIFDEVDTGVGGAVAEVIGRLLRELGDRHQVLCVTHLPQVAAYGGHHFQVSKTTSARGTASHIAPLDKEGRVHEIARMLGGLKITNTTRQHAKEMLAK